MLQQTPITRSAEESPPGKVSVPSIHRIHPFSPMEQQKDILFEPGAFLQCGAQPELSRSCTAVTMAGVTALGHAGPLCSPTTRKSRSCQLHPADVASEICSIIQLHQFRSSINYVDSIQGEACPAATRLSLLQCCSLPEMGQSLKQEGVKFVPVTDWAWNTSCVAARIPRRWSRTTCSVSLSGRAFGFRHGCDVCS